MKTLFNTLSALFICSASLLAQAPPKEPAKAKPAISGVDLSGAWEINGVRQELKLNAAKSSGSLRIFCAGDRESQLLCGWVDSDKTLHFDTSNQDISLLRCSAPYDPSAPEMKGSCVFGGAAIPTPRGLTAKRLPKIESKADQK